MSLVNKVLADLAARDPHPAPDPLVVDLRPVPTVRARRRGGRRLVLGSLALLAVAAGAAYWYHRAIPAPAAAPDDAETRSAPLPSVMHAPPPPAEPPRPLSADLISGPETGPTTAGVVPDQHIAPPQVAPDTRPSPVQDQMQSEPPASATETERDPPQSARRSEVASQTQERIPQRVVKAPRAIGPSELAQTSSTTGQRLLTEGRLVEGERQLRSAIDFDPSQVEAREALVGLLVDAERWDEAQAVLEAGVAATPEHVLFVQWLARLYIERGAEANAVALLESGFGYGGNDPEYLAFMGAAYQRLDRHADAVLAFEQALRLQPDNGRWWVGLGVSLEAQRAWAQARVAYERAALSPRQNPELARFARDRLAALDTRP